MGWKWNGSISSFLDMCSSCLDDIYNNSFLQTWVLHLREKKQLQANVHVVLNINYQIYSFSCFILQVSPLGLCHFIYKDFHEYWPLKNT